MSSALDNNVCGLSIMVYTDPNYLIILFVVQFSIEIINIHVTFIIIIDTIKYATLASSFSQDNSKSSLARMAQVMKQATLHLLFATTTGLGETG